MKKLLFIIILIIGFIYRDDILALDMLKNVNTENLSINNILELKDSLVNITEDNTIKDRFNNIKKEQTIIKNNINQEIADFEKELELISN